ncbi:MAG: hypothetical protein CL483_00110 [Acidobacteria bacterium]|nr:hypothetical protein [Acidobacteriota bacterium]
MDRYFTISALVLTVALSTATLATGQASSTHFRFNSGQSIQPFFDGWTHNDDGSFEFHFAYLNRNYVEELHIPAGPNNYVSPGRLDQGQPTYFYPRQHSKMFSVTVPADFGDGEVVWEVTVHGETYRAVGWLLPEWEIDPNPGDNRTPPDVLAANQAPNLSVASTASGSTDNQVTIEASVSDDGIPEPRQFRGGSGNVTPTFAPVDDSPTLPNNVPQLQNQNRHRPTRSRIDGVNVTWTQLRGQVGARLESSENVASVVATFDTPGAYLFRVQASDGPATVVEMVEITVR